MVLDTLVTKLVYLDTSLIIITSKGDFALYTRRDGLFVVEYDHPLRHKYIKNCDELKELINKETILKVYLLNHETSDETLVYTAQ
jgi:hypothetical protein